MAKDQKDESQNIYPLFLITHYTLHITRYSIMIS